MRGFTLIELVITCALLAFLVSTSVFASFNGLTRAHARTEQEQLATLLRKARAHAQHAVCQSAPCVGSGVRIESKNFVLFEGISFAERNVAADLHVPRSTSYHWSGMHEVLFEIGSGDAVTPGSFILKTEQEVHTVTVNSRGGIETMP